MKKEKIILVLNGEIPKKKNLISYIFGYNKILCADGAANTILNYDIYPDFILGDLDSICPEKLKHYNGKIIDLPDQNLNDLEKILIWCIDNNYNNIDIIGIDGKRIDHTIGNFSIILRFINKLNIDIITESGIFYTIKNETIIKNLKKKYISIFSYDSHNEISTIGLRYELKNNKLAELSSGTLNYAIKDEVKVFCKNNILFFIAHKKTRNEYEKIFTKI